MKLLQNYNFDIHARDDNGWTVLHEAAKSGDIKLLQYFIKNGSSVYSKTKKGSNCLHLAAYNVHLKMCKNLLRNYNFDIDARDDNGWTVLHIAAKSGDIKLLQYFIENESNVYSKTKNSSSYLYLAAYNGHLKMCKNLLGNYNFDIHARDNDEWTVLHIDAKSGDIKLFQCFIENVSNVYSKTKEGLNCLHIAAYKEHLKMCINLLQNYNFDIHARDDDGWTGLHKAVKSGNIELL